MEDPSDATALVAVRRIQVSTVNSWTLRKVGVPRSMPAPGASKRNPWPALPPMKVMPVLSEGIPPRRDWASPSARNQATRPAGVGVQVWDWTEPREIKPSRQLQAS